MWPELVLSTGYVCLVELGILSIRERGFGGLIHCGEDVSGHEGTGRGGSEGTHGEGTGIGRETE